MAVCLLIEYFYSNIFGESFFQKEESSKVKVD